MPNYKAFLKVKGNHIQNQSGQGVTLHGIGLGGWMNMENFITGFPANENAFRQVVYRALGVEKADFFVRVHATEMLHNQNFLVDLMGTALGKHLVNTYTFNGITKQANYVPGLPEDLKTALKTPPDPGPKPYVIVVPVRKDAEWWITGQDGRNAMMKEHTEATVAYLKTVKRKLYHASGLDDLDFITYFETAKLDDFNNLIIALERVKENRHNKQFGNPTLLGTIRPLDEILEILTL